LFRLAQRTAKRRDGILHLVVFMLRNLLQVLQETRDIWLAMRTYIDKAPNRFGPRALPTFLGAPTVDPVQLLAGEPDHHRLRVCRRPSRAS